LDHDAFAEKLGKLLVRTGFFIAAIAATFVVTACFDAPSLPLIDDNQQYFFIASQIADGVPPYESQFEPKNALCMLMTAVAILVGRVVGISDVVSARVFSIGILFGCVFFIQALCHRLTKRFWVSVLSGLLLLSFSAFSFMGLMGNRPKVFLVFFMVLALLAIASRRAKWAGMASMCAFLCWQPALLLVAICGITSVVVPPIGQGWKRGFYKFTGGALVPFGIYILYFIVTGSFGEMLHQAFFFPSQFMSNNFKGFIGTWKFLFGLWGWGFGKYNVVPIVAGVGLLRYILHLTGTWKLPETPDGAPLFRRGGWVVFAIITAMASLFTFYDQQGAPDLFFVLPSMAIFAALAVHFVCLELARLGDMVSIIAHNAIPILAIIAAITLIVQGPAVLADQMKWSNSPDGTGVFYKLKDQKQAAEELDAIYAKGHSICSLGSTHLLGLLRQPNWTKYGLFYRGVDEHVRWETGDNFKPEIDGQWPEYVLVSRRDPEGMDAWRHLYEDVTSPTFKDQQIVVLRRLGKLKGQEHLNAEEAEAYLETLRRKRQEEKEQARLNSAGATKAISESVSPGAEAEIDTNPEEVADDGRE